MTTTVERTVSMVPLLLDGGLPERAYRALEAFERSSGIERVVAYGRVVVELTRTFDLSLDEIDALLGGSIQMANERRARTITLDTLKSTVSGIANDWGDAAELRIKTLPHVEGIVRCDVEVRLRSGRDWQLLGTLTDVEGARREVRTFAELQRQRRLVDDEVSDPWSAE